MLVHAFFGHSDSCIQEIFSRQGNFDVSTRFYRYLSTSRLGGALHNQLWRWDNVSSSRKLFKNMGRNWFLKWSLVVASVIVVATHSCAALRSAAAQNYFCAGVSNVQSQRGNIISVSTQSNDIYIGSIGGSFDKFSLSLGSITKQMVSFLLLVVQKYDATTFALKSTLAFPKTARFQRAY